MLSNGFNYTMAVLKIPVPFSREYRKYPALFIKTAYQPASYVKLDINSLELSEEFPYNVNKGTWGISFCHIFYIYFQFYLTNIYVMISLISLEEAYTMKYELTKAETKVMLAIWSADHDMALPEIMEIAESLFHNGWKPQTVSTFLTRLVHKGFLNMYRRGRAFLYQPLFSRVEGFRSTITDTAELWFSGDMETCIKEIQSLI